MLILIAIVASIAVVLLALIVAHLREISRGILRVSHQLEYLGAPLEVQGGMLVAARRKSAN